MAKPSTLPRWATGGTAQITEPNEGAKDVGWVPLAKPPAQFFNWWQRLVYNWLVYLDGLTNEALSWSAKHSFSAGLSSSVAPVGNTDVARLWEVQQEAVLRQAADTLKANTSEVVNLTSNQNVAGVKTFISSPSVPVPVAGTDAANKTYVDALPTRANAFSVSPTVPTPTTSPQAAPKGYVDTTLAAAVEASPTPDLVGHMSAAGTAWTAGPRLKAGRTAPTISRPATGTYRFAHASLTALSWAQATVGSAPAAYSIRFSPAAGYMDVIVTNSSNTLENLPFGISIWF